jgi:hypothetical protein
LLHDADGWQDISSYFDLKIFIESNVENCLERLKIRNLAIPGYTAEEIIVRVDEVDRKNAETVLATKERADVVVESIVAKPTVEEDEDLQSQHQQSVHSGGLGMGRHSRVPSMEALNLIVTTNFNAEEEPHGISDYEVVEGMMMEDPLPPMGPLIGTWEKDMAQQIVEQMKQDPTRRPFMVGLVGMPGKYLRRLAAAVGVQEGMVYFLNLPFSFVVLFQARANLPVYFYWQTNWSKLDS